MLERRGASCWSSGLVIAALVVGCRQPALPVGHRTPADPPPADGTFSGKLASDRVEDSGRIDLDGDGIDDCWHVRWDGGSGAGGMIVSLRAPCDAAAEVIDTTASFGELVAEVELPAAIAARPRLRDSAIDLLYGRAHLRRPETIDDSFRWLIEQRRDASVQHTPEPFAVLGHYTPRWAPGLPRPPADQVMVIPDANRMLVYFAHNHGAVSQVASCGAHALLATRHAVAIHDRARDASSWVYVSLHAHKLRWPSVGRVTCIGELVVVEHGQQDTRELVVIAPRTGVYGTIVVDGPYLVDAHGITFGNTTHSATELIAALKR